MVVSALMGKICTSHYCGLQAPLYELIQYINCQLSLLKLYLTSLILALVFVCAPIIYRSLTTNLTVSPNTHCYGSHVCRDTLLWVITIAMAWCRGLREDMEQTQLREVNGNSKWGCIFFFNSVERCITTLVFLKLKIKKWQHNVPDVNPEMFFNILRGVILWNVAFFPFSDKFKLYFVGSKLANCPSVAGLELIRTIKNIAC